MGYLLDNMANGRVSYNGRERYEKLMVFGGVPVYSTNSDILVTKADVALLS